MAFTLLEMLNNYYVNYFDKDLTFWRATTVL